MGGWFKSPHRSVFGLGAIFICGQLTFPRLYCTALHLLANITTNLDFSKWTDEASEYVQNGTQTSTF